MRFGSQAYINVGPGDGGGPPLPPQGRRMGPGTPNLCKRSGEAAMFCSQKYRTPINSSSPPIDIQRSGEPCHFSILEKYKLCGCTLRDEPIHRKFRKEIFGHAMPNVLHANSGTYTMTVLVAAAFWFISSTQRYSCISPMAPTIS